MIWRVSCCWRLDALLRSSFYFHSSELPLGLPAVRAYGVLDRPRIENIELVDVGSRARWSTTVNQ
ncbi:hypothetical protein EDB19DRAFT_1775977 [Suillus lakei]|nr:hypothetical protein EDB19DRAFT_1775977 [Suillus lakei]